VKVSFEAAELLPKAAERSSLIKNLLPKNLGSRFSSQDPKFRKISAFSPLEVLRPGNSLAR
jgi:hypothetical protein